MNNLPCNCTTSPFTDPNYGHIVTRDICIVQNNKLGKLLCKGPRYRELVFVNFSICKTEKIPSDWCNKKGLPVKCFKQLWKKSTKKLKNLNKFKFRKVKQVLKDPEVISYLNISEQGFSKQPYGVGSVCKSLLEVKDESVFKNSFL